MTNFKRLLWCSILALSLNTIHSSALAKDKNLTLAKPEIQKVKTMRGDLNGDGIVNVMDKDLLISAWGDVVEGENDFADLNHDGIVGMQDLLIVLANFTDELDGVQPGQILTTIVLEHEDFIYEEQTVAGIDQLSNRNSLDLSEFTGLGGMDVDIGYLIGVIKPFVNKDELYIFFTLVITNNEDHRVTVRISHEMPICGGIANQSVISGFLHADGVYPEGVEPAQCASESDALAQHFIDGINVVDVYKCTPGQPIVYANVMNAVDVVEPQESIPVHESLGTKYEVNVPGNFSNNVTQIFSVSAADVDDITTCE